MTGPHSFHHRKRWFWAWGFELRDEQGPYLFGHVFFGFFNLVRDQTDEEQPWYRGWSWGGWNRD